MEEIRILLKMYDFFFVVFLEFFYLLYCWCLEGYGDFSFKLFDKLYFDCVLICDREGGF